jgi:hypothetical protein
MAHGEAEHGRAQGDPCKLDGHPEQQVPGKHQHRRPAGAGMHLDAAPGRPAESSDEEPQVPRKRLVDPGADPAGPVLGEAARQPSCRTELSGWSGAHRHGPVRPSQRVHRRPRPPGRWC